MRTIFSKNGFRLRSRGFTILEIMMVVVVVAVLIGISIPRIKGLMAQMNITKAQRELKTLQAAVESYRTFHSNALPSNISTDLVGATPPMIDAPLLDPFSGSDYLYTKSGRFYSIGTVGVDGISGSMTITSEGTVTVSGDDTAVTNGSFGAAAASAPAPSDPCDGTPDYGTVCDDGTVYAGPGYRTTAADEGVMDWAAAKQFCLNKGAGWRLPTVSELYDVLWVHSNTYCANFDFNGMVCPDPPPAHSIGGFQYRWYASSTEFNNDNTKAFFLISYDGNHNIVTTKAYLFTVRCVRSP